MDELSFKELYSVQLKTTSNMEVGGNTIEPGEVVASFDSIQIANFQEIKNHSRSTGGYGNATLIFWETTKEINLSFTQGIFSKTQLALMTNAKLIHNFGEENISIGMREELETNELGEVALKYFPNEPIFVYDSNTGKKLNDWFVSDNILHINEQFKSIIVDYKYNYNNGFISLQVGRTLTNGYLTLEGKMKVKDTTGKVVTGIIKIPKLRLMSDLSMKVGSDAIPQVGRLDAIAVPEGVRGQSKVMEIIFLNDDIDADM